MELWLTAFEKMLWNKCQLRMLYSEGQHTLLPFYITCNKQMAQPNVKQQAHLKHLISLCFGCFIASVSPIWSSFVMTWCFPSRCGMTRSSVAWSGIPQPSALTCSGTRCLTTFAMTWSFIPVCECRSGLQNTIQMLTIPTGIWESFIAVVRE
jgi:hypothetical protein